MSKPPAPAPPAGGPRRRRRKRAPTAPAPVEVVARAVEAKPLLEGKPIEEPLSAEELAELKLQLRFLREHRRTLQLRVNAHEDLLLNGVREPERRGVVQYLLSKVDRARVFGAAERLEPASATRLVEGVLRISPTLDYLLLYLECVQRSAPGARAISALVGALTRIDFSAVSASQMRRVLELIVELYEPAQLPQVLFGLFENKAFREAFDASAPELPEALARIVVPLRAVELAVLRDQPGRFGAERLAQGVALLLEGDVSLLSRHPAPARQRLFSVALATGQGRRRAARAGLGALLGSLPAPVRGELGLALAREWIAAGEEQAAKALLRELDAAPARRWLEALERPRRGRFALLGSAERPHVPALHLDTLEGAMLHLGSPPPPLVAPGVAPLLGSGVTEQGQPWFAVVRLGQRLSSLVGRRPGVPPSTLLPVCAEAARLLALLAQLGLALPDAQLGRFELDATERLWLTDWTGALGAAPEQAARAHAELLPGFCQAAFAPGIVPRALLDRLEGAADIRALAAALPYVRGA